jgi:hypothetical protein
LDAATSVAREVARFKDQRASMRNVHLRAATVANQMDKLAPMGSVHAQTIKDMKAWRSPAMSIAQQYQDLLGVNSAAMQAVSQWQEFQRAEQESVRKMIEPLTSIRISLSALELGWTRSAVHEVREMTLSAIC